MLLAAAIGVGIAFRLYQIGSLPFGVWFDEAENGRVARRILEDTSFRPVFAGEATQLLALFFYVSALALKFIGHGVLALRLVTTAAGILTLLFTHLLAQELFDPHRRAGHLLPGGDEVAPQLQPTRNARHLRSPVHGRHNIPGAPMLDRVTGLLFALGVGPAPCSGRATSRRGGTAAPPTLSRATRRGSTGGSLTIDGQELLTTPQADRPAEAQLTLTTGPHPIEVRLRNLGGFARISLQWTPPGGPTEIIPPERLSPR
ncbi:MAG: hypothetical protein C3F15_07470 [Holophagae bacterium]|nr:MAG: hypothetical protein C3F15_07470 [Holophagae bacterium]